MIVPHLLEDPDESVRFTAVEVLGKIGHPLCHSLPCSLVCPSPLCTLCVSLYATLYATPYTKHYATPYVSLYAALCVFRSTLYSKHHVSLFVSLCGEQARKPSLMQWQWHSYTTTSAAL